MKSLYEEIFKLKTTLRAGWLVMQASDKKSGAGRVESDGEHAFSMAILALEIMKKEKLKLDELKVLKMVLYHEIGEIEFGDHCVRLENISREEKFEAENKCIKRISEEYDMPEILQLWLEFEENKTPEAKFVKEMDKLDAILQSKIYSSIKGDDDVFNEFYNSYKTLAEKYKKYIPNGR